MSDTYERLIDGGVIDRARALHDTAIERMKQAEADLEKAKARHAEAETAANRAAAGEGDVSALDAEHAVADASVALASAVRVHAAAVDRHGRTHKNIALSEGVAWSAVAVDGVRRRLAAAAAGDAARAALAAAEQAYRDADLQLQQARGHGAALGPDQGNGLLVPLATERTRWAQAAAIIEGGVGVWTSRPFGFIA